MAEKRKLTVRRDDVLVLNGFEIDADVLTEIVKPNRRMLWAFVQSDDGLRIQPTPFTEDKVIWLLESDLVRDKTEV